METQAVLLQVDVNPFPRRCVVVQVDDGARATRPAANHAAVHGDRMVQLHFIFDLHIAAQAGVLQPRALNR